VDVKHNTIHGKHHGQPKTSGHKAKQYKQIQTNPDGTDLYGKNFQRLNGPLEVPQLAQFTLL